VSRTFSVDREAALAACSQAYYGHGKLEVLPKFNVNSLDDIVTLYTRALRISRRPLSSSARCPQAAAPMATWAFPYSSATLTSPWCAAITPRWRTLGVSRLGKLWELQLPTNNWSQSQHYPEVLPRFR
jgi:hypothetical protein